VSGGRGRRDWRRRLDDPARQLVLSWRNRKSRYIDVVGPFEREGNRRTISFCGGSFCFEQGGGSDAEPTFDFGERFRNSHFVCVCPLRQFGLETCLMKSN
jgi:hypothetical protein